ncbi:phenylalanine--tRNA ligase subunit alpha [Candidatus Woesearchaeota archaeon]|nr:phenylalanine--tRNA ligase subunit alpha [Candidatus Woesearchaeota archaeon]
MKSDVEGIADTLHRYESAVLSATEESTTLDEISTRTGLSKIECMRGMQWLQNKKAVDISTDEDVFIAVDSNGKEYLKKGFPEKRVLKLIKKGPASFKDIKKGLKLSDEEFNVCLGLLKSKAAAEIKDGKLEITAHGEKLAEKETLEESFLKQLSKKNARVEDLSPEEKFSYQALKKRKSIIKEETSKTKRAELTDFGKKLKKASLKAGEREDRLTQEMIRTGSWKKKEFRKYDIRINVPEINGGKRHFVNQTIESIKRIWLDMGFKEMTGPMLDTSFWNFDALFTAQDHPVRELQDTFYVKNPEKGRLPGKKLVDSVKSMHEDGGQTGSKGWGYSWDTEKAKSNVLRTHTTVLSAKTLANLKKECLPAKYFSVAKCFRNEALDWKHLFELYQVEGIVVDPEANFRNLIAYLKRFFRKLGFEKIRVQPAYFPYTEPSAEVHVFHPIKKEWVELAGAGIFRPEVVVPLLGEDIPVLAWGMGLERSISEYFGISDIRQLYSNDLKQLKEIKFWR